MTLTMHATGKAGLGCLQVRDDELLKGYALAIPAGGTRGHAKDNKGKKLMSIKPLK